MSPLTIDNDLLTVIRIAARTTEVLESLGASCHVPINAERIQAVLTRLSAGNFIEFVGGVWQERSR